MKPSDAAIKTASCWIKDDKDRGNNGWNPFIGAATEMAREILRLSETPPTEVVTKEMPDPPASMTYLEREAWKLGWYNGVYGRSPWDERTVSPQQEKT